MTLKAQSDYPQQMYSHSEWVRRYYMYYRMCWVVLALVTIEPVYQGDYSSCALFSRHHISFDHDNQ